MKVERLAGEGLGTVGPCPAWAVAEGVNRVEVAVVVVGS